METSPGGIPAYLDVRRSLLEQDRRCADVVAECRGRIGSSSRPNPFLEVFESANAAAVALDALPTAGRAASPLYGMTVAVNDNIWVAGEVASCGSRVLAGTRAPYDATAVTRLKAAGVIFVGRTNMYEFGMGSSSEFSSYGPSINPYVESRVPGGSSDGSAVAVATGAVHAALGSDAGGSVRQPAAFTGIVGFKPSYGRISRRGLATLSTTCDTMGIQARTVDDAALVFAAVSGEDEEDASTVRVPAWREFDRIDEGIIDIRFALPAEYLIDGLRNECRDVVVKALTWIMSHGAQASGAHLPMTEYAVAANYIIANAEASENLSRYGGVRYGESEEEVFPLPESRAEEFGEEVRRRLMLGKHVRSSNGGVLYQQALKVRRKIAADFNKAFEKVDVLLTPATVGTAFHFGAHTNDSRAMYLSNAMSAPANVAGIPAITIPGGFDMDGLPVGLQLMAKSMNETVLLRAARALYYGLKAL